MLVGKINKEIVGLINLHGGRAVGLSGKDGHLNRARKRMHRAPDGTLVDIGLVGEVEAINPEVIALLEDNGLIPVIARRGRERARPTSTPTSSGEVALLGAEKLIHLTDVQGILDSAGAP